MGNRTIGLVVALMICGTAAACGSPRPVSRSAVGDDAITVGSFDFPESVLLGEIYAQALEAHGFKVIRSLDLGPRELVDPALSRGLLEVVPEYEGSALDFFGGTSQADPGATWDQLRVIAGARSLVTLKPARAMDRNAFAMATERAKALHVSTLSDLRPIAGTLVFGGPPECPQRPLCLAGLQQKYGLSFQRFVPLDAGGPLTVQSLRHGLVDVALLFTSDPSFAGVGLVQLRDDLGLEPAENVTPLVRADALQRFPGMRQVLDEVSSHLTTDDLRRMNSQVALGQPVAAVARAWLASHGIG
jgi:osmoprotectant transport system substrate-binding protein